MHHITEYDVGMTDGILLTLQVLNKDADVETLEKLFREMLVALKYNEDDINHYVYNHFS